MGLYDPKQPKDQNSSNRARLFLKIGIALFVVGLVYFGLFFIIDPWAPDNAGEIMAPGPISEPFGPVVVD